MLFYTLQPVALRSRTLRSGSHRGPGAQKIDWVHLGVHLVYAYLAHLGLPFDEGA